jgi:hypothetical protein
MPPYRWAEQILISDRCVLMASGNALHLTACYDRH